MEIGRAFEYKYNHKFTKNKYIFDIDRSHHG